MAYAPLLSTSPVPLDSLIDVPSHGVASKILAKTDHGNVTLFAFDRGQSLSSHSSPFDGFLLVLDGTLSVTVDQTALDVPAGHIVRLPSNVPHAVDATDPSKMLLFMIK